MRENNVLALGHLILFFLTGNLDFQQAPGHWSRGLTTSHIWDCQKLPQKKVHPREPVGIAGAGEHDPVRNYTRPCARLKAPDATCWVGQALHPCQTCPSITGLLQKELSGTGLHSQIGKEIKREISLCTFQHLLSVKFVLP